MEIAFLTKIIIPTIYERSEFALRTQSSNGSFSFFLPSHIQWQRSFNARTIKINALKEIENEANYF